VGAAWDWPGIALSIPDPEPNSFYWEKPEPEYPYACLTYKLITSTE